MKKIISGRQCLDKYALDLLNTLRSIIKDPVCELNYSNVFELLIAVMLSAQCTDKRVNMVTPTLFAKYPTCETLADADISDVESIIHSCGTYRVKAKNIVQTSRVIAEKYNGVVPDDIDVLITLPGVGRKTASVVLSVGYNIPAMPVDTHILRVSNRLGIASSDEPRVVEEQLRSMYPREHWIELHHLMLLFGRYHCKAIAYKCDGCVMQQLCKKYRENNK